LPSRPLVNKLRTVKPLITVITPSFNQAQFIERTIHSVLDQRYPNLEYIVVDGGSTDGTLDILRRYEGQLRWISEKDSGQSEAINKGFRLAKGEIVAWLNSDDIYLPGALEEVSRHFVEHPTVMMVYGEGYMIDENDKVKCRFPFTETKFDLWKLIYHGDYILQQSTFFRRSVFDSIGLLDQSLHYTMDWDIFIRIGKRFGIDYVPEYLGSIREHGQAKTSTGGSRRFQEIKGTVRKHGLMRYPPAYFNYAWDTYGNGWFANGSGARSGSLRRKTLLITRRLLEVFFSYYQKRLQQGYYADGWVGKRVMIVMPNVQPEVPLKQIVLLGEAHAPNVPFRLTFRVNKEVLLRHKVRETGPFTLTVPLRHASREPDCFHVQITSSKTFVPRRLEINEDHRALGFLLRSIEVVAPCDGPPGASAGNSR
jgi:glycosyltransferase involved in cell wall biosynthesis